jgi:hypothetical protein
MLPHERNLRTHQTGEENEAAFEGLRRVPENGRQLGPFAVVPGVRARGMLRFFEEQTRYKAFSRFETSGCAITGAGRTMDVVLRG